MRKTGRVSKVAICPKCHGYIIACHVDFLNKESQKEFTELRDEGFWVKLETIEETKNREIADYSICSKKKCEPKCSNTKTEN